MARCAGIAPGHSIMPGHTGPALPHAAEDRIAGIGRTVHERRNLQYLLAREQLGIHTVDLHGVDEARGDFHLDLAVGDHHHAALREHDVVVQLA